MNRLKYLIYFTLFIGLVGCDNFLDVRPSIKLVVPESLDDLEALMNNQDLNVIPANQILASDELFLQDDGYIARSFVERRIYTWEVELYDITDINFDWWLGYGAIYVANTVLFKAADIEPTSSNELEHKNELMGRAYFARAYLHYHLLQNFSKPYDPATAGSDLGIPLRLTDDVQTVVQRATIKEVYDQIESDLNAAYNLLPESQIRKSKASKRAIDALKARMYLAMRKYDEALEFANKVLNRQSNLMIYEELDGTQDYMFPLFNEEVIFHSQNPSYGFINGTTTYVNPDLIETYDDNDLRKSYFFIERPTGYFSFYSSYSGYYLHFTGLATDEMYLIVAEVLARNGQIIQSMDVLNNLISTRYISGTFSPFVASSSTEALNIVLQEREKQLIHRGTRWSDLRRLNFDPETAKTLTRVVQGNTYTLPPNDPRYVFSISPDEINISGIVQNPRQ